MKSSRIVTAVLYLLLLSSVSAWAENAVTAGQFIVEPTTLICAGFEWYIQGDDNRNAAVEVSFRKKGATAWQQGLPLLRLKGERVFNFERGIEYFDYTVPNMFAGSIFNLEPGAEYECRFTLTDPDGVKGEKVQTQRGNLTVTLTGPDWVKSEKVQTVTVRTRTEPKPCENGRVFHVYPHRYKGERQIPSYTGFFAAYFGYAAGGDWSAVPKPQVKPGDIILVHAGVYRMNRYNYGGSGEGDTFHGTYVLTADGTPDKPIVIKSAGDGEVIFDGGGSYRLFDVMAADYHYFEGLTIRNTDIAFYSGVKDVLGSSGLTVRNCRMEDVGIGVMAEYAGSKNLYIADNVILGRQDRTRLHGWSGFWLKLKERAPMNSYYAVKVYGQGHVVCHNYIAYFHDAIDVDTHGIPDEAQDQKGVSIDFYNNDISLICDNFIEADGGVHNIRIFNNRGVNVGHRALSAQPAIGGPVYFIKNVVYHAPSGSFNLGDNPAGIVAFHNTCYTELSSSTFSNGLFRNNLFLVNDQKNRPAFSMSTYTSYTSFDYNGYRINPNSDTQFVWKAPAVGKVIDVDIDVNAKGRYDMKDPLRGSYKTLEEFSKATGQEQHGVLVDYDIFLNVPKTDPNKPEAVYTIKDIDFRLKPGSKAVDAGCVLPNINDGYTGKAPDLGAIEVGAPEEVYGPRTGNRP